MKKLRYEKPIVMLEHFELTQAISACAIRVSATDVGCIIRDPDPSWAVKDLVISEGYFMLENDFGGCSTQPEDGGENGLCYHTAANALFVS